MGLQSRHEIINNLSLTSIFPHQGLSLQDWEAWMDCSPTRDRKLEIWSPPNGCWNSMLMAARGKPDPASLHIMAKMSLTKTTSSFVNVSDMFRDGKKMLTAKYIYLWIPKEKQRLQCLTSRICLRITAHKKPFFFFQQKLYWWKWNVTVCLKVIL